MKIDRNILEMAIVKETILAVRIMWDCRNDKPYYYRVHWLKGIAAEYEEVLSMLFEQYAEPYETPKVFARRLMAIDLEEKRTAELKYYGSTYLLTEHVKNGKKGAIDEAGNFYYMATARWASDYGALWCDAACGGEHQEMMFWCDMSDDLQSLFRNK